MPKILIVTAGNFNCPDENHLHYVLMAQALSRGFIENGSDVILASSSLPEKSLKLLVEKFCPDLIFEFNKTRNQSGDVFPKDIPHFAWIHDGRINQRLHCSDPNFGGSELVYTLVNPLIFGFTNLNNFPANWKLLHPGVDTNTFKKSSTYTAIQRELTICGYIPYPLDDGKSNSIFFEAGKNSIKWKDLENYLLHHRQVSIGKDTITDVHLAIIDKIRNSLSINLELSEFRNHFLEDTSLLYFDIEVPRIRERILLAESAMATGRRFEIYGMPSWLFWSKYVAHYAGNLLWPSDLAKIYGSTLINLHNGAFGMHSRVLESMACGCAVFVNQTNIRGVDSDIRKFLTPGDDYIEYTSGDLKDKLHHYLSHPEQAKEIGQAGAAAIAKAHTWKHRAAEILSDLETHVKDRSEIDVRPSDFYASEQGSAFSLYSAQHHIGKKNYEAADTLASKLILHNPRNAIAHFIKGLSLLNRGKIEDAEQHFKEDHDISEQNYFHSDLSRSNIRVIRKYFIGERIGEANKHLDIFAKTGILGWRLPFIGVYPLGRQLSNSSLHDYWNQHVNIVTSEQDANDLSLLAKDSEYCTTTSAIPGGRIAYADIAWHHVQYHWEANSFPPILQLSDQHKTVGRRMLEKWGIKTSDWFVVFHIREGGFHGEPYINVRNCDPATYLSAMERIVQLGGWVIRLGDPTMSRLPRLNQVIDYATSSDRADWMDIFLIGACRFFVSSASGPCAIANSFGTPQLQTNVFPAIDRPWSKNDIFLPKLFRYRESKKIMPFATAMHSHLIVDDDKSKFDNLGLEVVDNESDDILNAVNEMIDSLTSESGLPPLTQLQEHYDTLSRQTLGIVSSRISASFAERNAHLLDFSHEA